MHNEFRFDEFRLDITNACLWHDGEKIHLTPKAFEVLQYLLTHPDQLLTRKQLLDAVWPNVVVGDSALASAIRELRKALGDDAKTPRYIETVHRRGYRFIGNFNYHVKPVIAQDVAESPKSRFTLRQPYWITAALVVAISVVGWLFLREPTQQAVVASEAALAYPLPDRPSLIVMPFDNLIGDPSQDYFVDGITETITTALARIPALFVIARHSAMTYKDKAVSVKQIAEEQGIRYVLKGSIQKSGERLKVTAQLVDALGGHHLWADDYDYKAKDIFEVQDSIARNVATELEVKLGEGELARMWRGYTRNADAYALFLQGLDLMRNYSKIEMLQAQKLFEQALAIDPNFLPAKGRLAWNYWQQARFEWVDDPAAMMVRAEEIARQVLAIDATHPAGLAFLALLHYRKGEIDEAIVKQQETVDANPNASEDIALLGYYLALAGRAREGIPLIIQGMRQSPYYPAWMLSFLGQAHYALAEYDQAITAFEETLARRPYYNKARGFLACSYAQVGRMEEARAAVEVIIRQEPEWTLRLFAKDIIMSDPALKESILNLLRELGLPEE